MVTPYLGIFSVEMPLSRWKVEEVDNIGNMSSSLPWYLASHRCCATFNLARGPSCTKIISSSASAASGFMFAGACNTKFCARPIKGAFKRPGFPQIPSYNGKHGIYLRLARRVKRAGLQGNDVTLSHCSNTRRLTRITSLTLATNITVMNLETVDPLAPGI